MDTFVEDINRRHGLDNATTLWYAADDGAYTRCERLLLKGADINIPGGYRITPLWVAARRGRSDLVKLFLEYGADPNISSVSEFTPQYLKYQYVILSISQHTPLYVAAWLGHLDTCMILLAHGANPNMVSGSGHIPLTIAALNKHYDICKYFMLNTEVDHKKVFYYFGNLLCLFSHHGDAELCERLVQSLPLASIERRNRDGKTALNEAAEQEHLQVFKFLLQNGAEISNLKDVSCLYKFYSEGLIDHTEIVGNNFAELLCHCSLQGDLGLCQQLILSKPEADLTMNNINGETALFVAFKTENFQILEYLMELGGDLNLPNQDGSTALYYASKNGLIDLVKKCVEEYKVHVEANECLSVSAVAEHYDVVEYLLSKETTWNDIDRPIKDDLTPLYFVCRGGLLELVKKYVKEYKANINVGCLHVALEFYHNSVAEFLINSGCRIINQVKMFEV